MGTDPNMLMAEALVGAGTSVWAWDMERDVLTGMNGSVALLGYRTGELESTQAGWNAVIHPDDLADNDAAYLRHARGEVPAYESEYRARAKDGRWRWLAERGRIVEWWPDGRPRRMVGTLTDVTLRRQVEAEAAERDRRSRELAAAAEAANRAKTEFLSRMSHELRTPLNAVLGFAQLMELDEADPLSDGQRHRLTLVRESGEHLLRMIADLLDHSRIEAGQLAVELSDVELLPLVRECAGMLAPAAQHAEVSVHWEGVPAGLKVRADPTRLRQVVLNLLSNAIKYNRRGGEVQLRAALHDDELRLSVVDTGVGMSPAHMDNLFEPFNRLGQRRSGIEGTGIGLAITRALVTLMQGRIEVRSHIGKGSTFSVTLPAARA